MTQEDNLYPLIKLTKEKNTVTFRYKRSQKIRQCKDADHIAALLLWAGRQDLDKMPDAVRVTIVCGLEGSFTLGEIRNALRKLDLLDPPKRSQP